MIRLFNFFSGVIMHPMIARKKPFKFYSSVSFELFFLEVLYKTKLEYSETIDNSSISSNLFF